MAESVSLLALSAPPLSRPTADFAGASAPVHGTPAGSVRDRLLALVLDQPGINKSNLCDALGVAWGTVAYHIDVLANARLVEVQAQGRETHLFPHGVAGHRRRLLLAMRDPAAQRVLGVVAAARESSLAEVCLRAGLTRKVVRRQLAQLLAAGLVEDKGTRRPRYAVPAAQPGRAAVSPPASSPFLFGRATPAAAAMLAPTMA